MTVPPKRPLSPVQPGSRSSREIAGVRKTIEEAQAERALWAKRLPHIYRWKWYGWARAFYESTNRMNLLCAANQISKSSTQHRKWIDWATNTKKWPKLWKTRPTQFWYLYPNKDVATIEWHTKILPEFMPGEEYKNHPVYGWTVEFEKKKIYSVSFNSGVTVYFKTYAQDVHDLQSGTVHAIFTDEELPENLYSELQARLFATEGYFHMVFTATRNQLMWLQAIEGKGEEETFKEAFKQQISMYDCMRFTDGSAGVYTEEKIQQIKAGCKNDTEILRRVYGRFVREHGRCISEFDPVKHIKKPFSIPRDWRIYGAADPGSGGEKGHPGAVSFLAVRPDYRFGALFRGWRGDNIQTTAGDILDKFMELKAGDECAMQIYDWASRDFATIAERTGESFQRAEKSHDIGEDIVNTLFKNDMLVIFGDDPELGKLGTELMTVMKDTPKNRRKDDLSDTLRYNCAAVPWDWSHIRGIPTDEQKLAAKNAKPWTEEDQLAWEIDQRRGIHRKDAVAQDPYLEEFAFWNDRYG